jgi:hypothetical protein
LTGRDDELAELTELADLAATTRTSRVVVIAGVRGSGRTALALNWAWGNADRFSGGHLYADFDRYREPEGVLLIDVMGRFLRALGMRDVNQPPGFPARIPAFRTLTAQLPLVVLLDNADQAAQVRGFVPTAAGSMVLVTSQSRLSGLNMDGAHTIHLEPLEPRDPPRTDWRD